MADRFFELTSATNRFAKDRWPATWMHLFPACWSKAIHVLLAGCNLSGCEPCDQGRSSQKDDAKGSQSQPVQTRRPATGIPEEPLKAPDYAE